MGEVYRARDTRLGRDVAIKILPRAFTSDPDRLNRFEREAWLLGSTPAGNMTVSAPAAAVLGATGTINLSFGALTPGTKYLGSVAYGGSAGMPNPTIVRVDP